MSTLINYEKKVHVFDNKGNSQVIDGYSVESLFGELDLDNFQFNVDTRDKNEFKTILSKDFWINIFNDSKHSLEMITRNLDIIFNNIEIVTSYIQKNKVLCKRVTFLLALFFMISANPAIALTTTPLEKLQEFGLDLIAFSITWSIVGILSVTSLKFLSEYVKGGSKYKLVEVFRVAILVMSLVLITPLAPKFLKYLIEQYLLCLK